MVRFFKLTIYKKVKKISYVLKRDQFYTKKGSGTKVGD
jgi:hypothetical protein